MMKSFKLWTSKHSLKFKLNVSILTFICVAFISLAIFISKYTAPILESQLENNAKKSIEAYVADFTHLTIDAERVILNTKNTLSQMQEDNVSAIRMLLNSAMKTVIHTDLDFTDAWLYVFDPEDVSSGDLYISTDYDDDNIIDFNVEHLDNLYDRFPWFQEVPKKEDIYWSEPYVDTKTDKTVFTCLIPFKFINQTDFNGLLALTIDLTNIQKSINNFSFYETGKLILLSRTGLYVTYPTPDVALKLTIFELAKRLKQPDLERIGKDLLSGRGGQIIMDNVPVFKDNVAVFFYAPIKHLGWGFCLVYSQHEFLKPIKQFQIIIAFALLASVLLLMLIINWICHYSTKQLLTLSHIAAQYGRGNFSQNFNFIPNSSDIGMLSKALSNMRENLLNYLNKERQQAYKEQKAQSELDIARHIQTSALSTTYPKNDAFELATTMIPAREVGGDFYDFSFINDHQFAVVVADVSGKGIPAALYMMKAITLIKNMSRSKLDLDFMIQCVNELLCEGNDTCMFVTAFMAIIDLPTGKTTYVNAGHNPPLVGTKDGYLYLSPKKNIVLGINSKARFEKEEITLSPGDHLFLYTDGVTEAENKNSKFYGETRLLKILNKTQNKAHNKPQENINMILKDIQKFVKDNPQSDDITMLDFAYLGSEKDVLTVPAEMNKLNDVLTYIKNNMKKHNISEKAQFNMVMASEEIFANIVSYAYKDKKNADVTIKTEISDNTYFVTFIDKGKKYNPLENKDPDVKAKIKDRSIGGLGIFLAKKVSDTISYQHKNGCNILKIGVIINNK